MFNNAALIDESTRLQKFAYRLTKNGSDAEDLLQSTLVRAMEKKHLFREGTNLYSWLSKIMFNLFVSKYRRKTKFETQYDPEPYLESQTVNPQQDVKLQYKDVSDAVSKLSPDHRDIMLMVCVKGMRYAEVSDKLDIPVGTVRSRLSRARERLKELMDDDQPANTVYANHNIQATERRIAA